MPGVFIGSPRCCSLVRRSSPRPIDPAHHRVVSIHRWALEPFARGKIMSNKVHEHVHRLIHSMSRAEKRYFKLTAKRFAPQGESHQVLLFDAIAKMQEYDEAALLKRFKGRPFTHRFPITKRRLYEAVLRSLDAFHAEGSLDARLDRGLHQVRILHDKALYEDARKLLQGLHRLASQYERPHTLLAILDWKRRLAERDNYAHISDEGLDELEQEGRALRDAQQELEQLWGLKSRVFMDLYRKGGRMAHDRRQAVQELLPMKGPAGRFTSKAHFLEQHILGAAAFAAGDIDGCRLHLEANLELLLAHPDRFRSEPDLLLSTLGNLAYVCAMLDRGEEARRHLKQFREAPALWRMPENEDLERKLFSTSYGVELGLCLRDLDAEAAMSLVVPVERGLAHMGERLGPIRRAGLQIQLAWAYLLNDRVAEAYRTVKQLIDALKPEQSPALHGLAKALHIALLHDAGKQELLPYAVRNTERFLQNYDQQEGFHLLFLQLARVLAKQPETGAAQEALLCFVRAAGQLNGEDVWGDQDKTLLLAWATARAHGVPMREVRTLIPHKRVRAA